MIHTELSLGEEEQSVLYELSLDGPQAVKYRKNLRLLCFVLAFLLLYLGIAERSLLDLIFCAVAVLLGTAALRPIQRMGMKNTLKRWDDKLKGNRTYDFSDSGVDIVSAVGTSHCGWDSFVAAGEKSHYLWFRRVDNSVVLADESRLSPEELAVMKEYADKIGK